MENTIERNKETSHPLFIQWRIHSVRFVIILTFRWSPPSGYRTGPDPQSAHKVPEEISMLKFSPGIRATQFCGDIFNRDASSRNGASFWHCGERIPFTAASLHGQKCVFTNNVFTDSSHHHPGRRQLWTR